MAHPAFAGGGLIVGRGLSRRETRYPGAVQVEQDLEQALAELQRLRRSARFLRNEALYQNDRAWRLRMETLRQQMRLREFEKTRLRTPGDS